MSDVVFDEDPSITRSSLLPASKPPLFIQFMISKGWVTSQKQGETILLWVAGLALVIAFGIYQLGKGHSHPSGPATIPLVTQTRTSNMP